LGDHLSLLSLSIFLSLSLSTCLASMRFLSTCLLLLGGSNLLNVCAQCLGTFSHTPADTAGIPTGAGTPNVDALAFFWTRGVTNGNMKDPINNNNLGGYPGADYFCNKQAAGSSSTAYVQARAPTIGTGLFLAVLSNAFTNARDRFISVGSGDSSGSSDVDVTDSEGNCIAAGVYELFWSPYNLDFSVRDNGGLEASTSTPLFTGSDLNGGMWATIGDNTGLFNTQAELNSAYCSQDTGTTGTNWDSQAGLQPTSIGTIGDPAFNAANLWLSSGPADEATTSACSNGLHIYCLQAAPYVGTLSGDPQFTGMDSHNT
jgi:hypothetical protein